MESLERLQQQLWEAKRQWQESSLEKSESVSAKLQKEVDRLRCEIEDGAQESPAQLMSECVRAMNVVKEGLTDEISGVGIAQKWMLSRMGSPIRRPPESRVEQEGILKYAQQTIEENRKQREMSMKEVAARLRAMGENVPQ